MGPLTLAEHPSVNENCQTTARNHAQYRGGRATRLAEGLKNDADIGPGLPLAAGARRILDDPEASHV
jgi:hypothetical protein